jgi:archaellum component FlaC
MNQNAEKLSFFIQKIRSVGFFQRLFFWKSIQNSLIDAASALSRLQADAENLQESKNALSMQLSDSRKDIEIIREQKLRLENALSRMEESLGEKARRIEDITNELTESQTNCKNSEKEINRLGYELVVLEQKLYNVNNDLKKSTEECIRLKKDEEARNTDHTAALSTLQTISQRVQDERSQEVTLRQLQELERLSKLKDTWFNHQTNVKNAIKNICNKHTIEYVGQVPFKGDPDNTLKICDEFIVFDAKSPAGDDASNFYNYLKDQAEKAKKYARQEGVKQEIFFVVPANTLEHIKQSCFPMAEYTVYIIAADSLEPIILSLKKVENYEFAQQLSPEERENICRIIGRFAHLTKRRIQIDSFFAKQFIEIVYKCEGNLPDDILQKVAEFERSEKLNPPMEKRAKAINTRQLDGEILKLEAEVESRGIAVEDLSDSLNQTILYRD